MTGVVQTTIGGLSIANIGDVGRDFPISPGSFHLSVGPFPLALPHVDELLRCGPSGLLQDTSRVVDFTGRQPELAELTGWLEDQAGSAVMLMPDQAAKARPASPQR